MTDPRSQAPRQKLPRFALDGVLLLDKPLGLSSNDALVRAKRLLQAVKAGHTGTLDPLATGLLPLCFGEATKFSQDLLDADKTYEAHVRLGETTTTGDAEGEVLQTRPVTVDEAAIRAILPRFTGPISQVPPMYSALKRDGKPLYEYARAGQTLEREARQVTIRSLELVTCSLPGAAEFTFRVTCSKGTYVRTLAEDIGEALGCGAHLRGLRRTAVGPLTLEGAVTLEMLAALDHAQRVQRLAPVDALLRTLPAVWLDETLTKRFSHGQRLRLDDARCPQPLRACASAHDAIEVKVYAEASDAAGARLLGVARLDGEGLLTPQRLLKTQ
ncbi:tRNA pseudouridine(55) synthase TruB [Pandoraea nosoerga]|uniref:tRNA pseudouridine synthase B n=1 Tax=Pandoraea nosoerga TaxID=2508296 RepID=A0A5E4VFI0_9BURK|nr:MULTISPECIES: tRNA pseudouridine(55) synthase TruB [Pandoraea]MBN4668175.1 tRNA pseudouridine(55) synthase TruB [Pandoraea nosoerga]MBN4678045.1 tRNA pseudouridine(55) synthase TruB [Pandoraea nosoerga]MBN4682840.1 tRNA pseudouridine(55) synthase TruB [Pandoraea nosoerga]MBN4747172.1 tRNA pseudouridine(55) synthase TruB [Pandoraea nosoerga]VVE11048.1 tRNA pseudouridine(55) synthase TruB [Pandoraea nosoerga]